MDMVDTMAANTSMADATERFEAERVPFSMILIPDELTRDPHAVAIGLFEESDHPVVGRIRLPRHPVRFNATPAALAGSAPALGQHTDEVLTELGLAEQIATLRAEKVVM